MKFIQHASTQVTDLRTFLRDASSDNSIKYAASKGVKHIVYIPFMEKQVINPETNQEQLIKTLCALQNKLHEWKTADGKFKSTICLDGYIEREDENDPNSALINDGTCPICDRVEDAWDIFNYRKELEEATCTLTGQARKEYLEKASSQFGEERKAKAARPYIYMLVALFKTDSNGNPTLGQDQLPEFEIKVMKMSASRLEKIYKQFSNMNIQFEGSEVMFEYPNVDDRRLLVSQSTTTPILSGDNSQRITDRFPGVVAKINAEVQSFNWNAIDTAFPEWKGMTVEAARKLMDDMFAKWDAYKREKVTNSSAKYLEYVIETPNSNPAIGGAMPQNQMGAGMAMPTMPQMPTMPTMPQGQAGAGMTMPTMTQGQAGAGMAMPTMPAVNPNEAFNGENGAPMPV